MLVTYLSNILTYVLFNSKLLCKYFDIHMTTAYCIDLFNFTCIYLFLLCIFQISGLYFKIMLMFYLCLLVLMNKKVLLYVVGF